MFFADSNSSLPVQKMFHDIHAHYPWFSVFIWEVEIAWVLYGVLFSISCIAHMNVEQL